MDKKNAFSVLLFVLLFVALILLWFLFRAKIMMQNININTMSPSPEQTHVTSLPSPEQTETATPEKDTLNTPLPDNIVIDPDSGQYVLYNELTILASGEDVKKMVEEFDGEIVLSVKETDSYQVRFPVSDLSELKKIGSALESKGLTVYYTVVLVP